MVGICVLGQLLDGFFSQSFGLGVYQCRQFQCSLRYNIPAVAGHKRRFHNGTVVIHDVCITNKVVHLHKSRPTAKQGQTWGK